jgi:hypothetical protein
MPNRKSYISTSLLACGDLPVSGALCRAGCQIPAGMQESRWHSVLHPCENVCYVDKSVDKDNVFS